MMAFSFSVCHFQCDKLNNWCQLYHFYDAEHWMIIEFKFVWNVLSIPQRTFYVEVQDSILFIEHWDTFILSNGNIPSKMNHSNHCFKNKNKLKDLFVYFEENIVWCLIKIFIGCYFVARLLSLPLPNIHDKALKSRNKMCFLCRTVYFYFWFVIHLRIGIILTEELIRAHEASKRVGRFLFPSDLFLLVLTIIQMNEVLESRVMNSLSW